MVSSGPNSQAIEIGLAPPKSVWQTNSHQVKTEALIAPIRPWRGDAKSTDIGWKIPVVFREIQVQRCVRRDESPVPFTLLALELFNCRGIGIKLMESQSDLDPPLRLTVELHYI